MTRTLTVNSLFLVALGAIMTVWLFPHPLAFVPYVLLFFAARAARRPMTRVVVLGFTLCCVCIGFWYFFDAVFVHPSTLNFLPLEIAVGDSLIAGLLLLVVYRSERGRRKSESTQ